MTKSPGKNLRVLAIDPTVRGFAFVVFEAPTALLDWGLTASRRHKHRWCISKAIDLMKAYEPDVLVLENPSGSRRCERIRALIKRYSEIARRRKIRVRTFSQVQVRKAFTESGARTKYEIASIICSSFPDLAPFRPRFRKPWMAEDVRMNIFDAAALAETFVSEQQRFRKLTESQVKPSQPEPPRIK